MLLAAVIRSSWQLKTQPSRVKVLAVSSLSQCVAGTKSPGAICRYSSFSSTVRAAEMSIEFAERIDVVDLIKQATAYDSLFQAPIHLLSYRLIMASK